jgi:sensor domain CHASE-containing protein
VSELILFKMESHVLIPEELSLSVRSPSGCSSPSVARLLEQRVAVVAARDIARGTRFGPAQGTIRIGRIDVYSTLQDNDVSIRKDVVRN